MWTQTKSATAKALRTTAAVLLISLLSFVFPATVPHVNAESPGKTRAERGGQKEGIAVHGHWTIDVRNPDGRLVTRRDFENKLEIEGNAALARVLGREQTVGLWYVILYSFEGNHPCADGGNASACNIFETTVTGLTSTTSQFNTLKVSVPTSAPALVLKGTAIASRTGVIDVVVTQLRTCLPNKDCASIIGGQYPFSSKRLTDNQNGTCVDRACAVTIVEGQTVDITVSFTFS